MPRDGGCSPRRPTPLPPQGRHSDAARKCPAVLVALSNRPFLGRSLLPPSTAVLRLLRRLAAPPPTRGAGRPSLRPRGPSAPPSPPARSARASRRVPAAQETVSVFTSTAASASALGAEALASASVTASTLTSAAASASTFAAAWALASSSSTSAGCGVRRPPSPRQAMGPLFPPLEEKSLRGRRRAGGWPRPQPERPQPTRLCLRRRPSPRRPPRNRPATA